MDFGKALKNFNDTAKAKIKAGRNEELLKFLQNGASALSKLYTEDVSSLFKAQKIDTRLQDIKKGLSHLNNEIASYQIKENGRIIIELTSGEKLEKRLDPMHEFLGKIGIGLNDPNYLFFLGYFSLPSRYEETQLFFIVEDLLTN